MSVAKRVTIVLSLVLVLGACDQSSPKSSKEPSDPRVSQSAGPLSGKVVVVDPGHNGGNADHPEVVNEEVDVVNGKKPCNTTGTRTADGYAEHKFNFSVAGHVIERLESAGAKVVTTRESDDGVGPCVDERAEIGNDEKADAVVSIHADGGPASGRGFHIMEPMPLKGHDHDIVEVSHELATAIANTYQTATDIPPSDYIGDEHGINPRDDMGGLNLSSVPAVMVECGNMVNDKDAKLLSNKEFHRDIADGIVGGVVEHLG